MHIPIDGGDDRPFLVGVRFAGPYLFIRGYGGAELKW